MTPPAPLPETERKPSESKATALDDLIDAGSTPHELSCPRLYLKGPCSCAAHERLADARAELAALKARSEAMREALRDAMSAFDLIAVKPLGESAGCFEVVNEGHRLLAVAQYEAIKAALEQGGACAPAQEGTKR
jgi:hypothetical protein